MGDENPVVDAPARRPGRDPVVAPRRRPGTATGRGGADARRDAARRPTQRRQPRRRADREPDRAAPRRARPVTVTTTRTVHPHRDSAATSRRTSSIDVGLILDMRADDPTRRRVHRRRDESPRCSDRGANIYFEDYIVTTNATGRLLDVFEQDRDHMVMVAEGIVLLREPADDAPVADRHAGRASPRRVSSTTSAACPSRPPSRGQLGPRRSAPGSSSARSGRRRCDGAPAGHSGSAVEAAGLGEGAASPHPRPRGGRRRRPGGPGTPTGRRTRPRHRRHRGGTRRRRRAAEGVGTGETGTGTGRATEPGGTGRGGDRTEPATTRSHEPPTGGTGGGPATAAGSRRHPARDLAGGRTRGCASRWTGR